MDKYGTVDDHIEPLDDGIYYRVDDVDAMLDRLHEVIDRGNEQFYEMAEIAERSIDRGNEQFNEMAEIAERALQE